MKKQLLSLFAGALALLFAGAGCTPPPSPMANNATDTPAMNGTKDTCVTFAGNGFTICYPPDFTTAADSLVNKYGTGRTAFLNLTPPLAFFQNTNLIEGEVSVGKEVTTKCFVMEGAENSKQNGTLQVAGVTFTRVDAEGAAAGNVYDFVSYRTMKGRECWDVTLFMHSGNVGNYGNPKPLEFGRPQLVKVFEEAVKTFRFVP